MNYKDQINSLMRDFAVYLKESKFEIKRNGLSRIAFEKDRPSRKISTKKFIEKKEDILLYLYTVVVNLANEDYVANINTIPEFSNINFIENSNNYVPGIKNKMILKNIRNAFDHASGIVEIDKGDITITNNHTMKNRATVKFSVKQSKQNLISLFKQSIANQKQSKNPIIKTLMDDIEKIENDDFANVSDQLCYIILMNLLLCYNKESLIDKFIQSQMSFLDMSHFSITTEKEWDKKEIHDDFLKLYIPIFKDDSDRQSYNREWRKLGNFNSSSDKAFIYDVTKYPIDKKTRKHIPTPIVLKHLRDANAHGWIEFKDGKIFLYDKKKKNSPSYIEISISEEDMWKLLNHDIFFESMYTYVDTFSNQRDDEMFFFERAKSAEEFETYIRIYQLRLAKESKRKAIDYLFKSNKISSYILEHPEQLNAALNYKVDGDKTLLQYALRKSNMTMEDFYKNAKKFGKNDREWAKDYTFVSKKYMDALCGKDLEFFKAYFCFLYNKDRIKNFLDYNNLTPEENEFVESEAEKLKEQLSNSKVSVGKNPIILTEVMFTMFPRNNATVFKDVLYAVYTYNKYQQRTEKKQFDVMNVESYSSLSKERENGIEEQSHYNEIRKKIAKKGLTGAAIIIASQLLFSYAIKHGIDITHVKPTVVFGGVLGVMALRNSLIIGAKNLLDKYKKRKKDIKEERDQLLNEKGNPDFNKGDR